jgi:signal transduction histidine kinase
LFEIVVRVPLPQLFQLAAFFEADMKASKEETPDEEEAFERFVHGPASRGSGLGLAIAKSLVQAHGGTISAESQPGRGTTIRFVLPAA